MKKIITTMTALLLCTSCASDQTFAVSEQAIADQGYTNIQYQGWAWMACGEDDSFALKYSANAPNGRSVTLVACSGVFKGVTVRTIN